MHHRVAPAGAAQLRLAQLSCSEGDQFDVNGGVVYGDGGRPEDDVRPGVVFNANCLPRNKLPNTKQHYTHLFTSNYKLRRVRISMIMHFFCLKGTEPAETCSMCQTYENMRTIDMFGCKLQVGLSILINFIQLQWIPQRSAI